MKKVKNVKFENFVDFPSFAIGNEYDLDVLARAGGYLSGDAVADIYCDIDGYRMKLEFSSRGEQKVSFGCSEDKALEIASKYAKTKDRHELLAFIEIVEESFNRGEFTEAWEFEFYKEFNEAVLVDWGDNSWYEANIVITKDGIENQLFSDCIYSSIEEIENISKDEECLVSIFTDMFYEVTKRISDESL